MTFINIVLWVLICKTVVVSSIPEAALNLHSATDRFQNSVQQQTFIEWKSSIRRRSRNGEHVKAIEKSVLQLTGEVVVSGMKNSELGFPDAPVPLESTQDQTPDLEDGLGEGQGEDESDVDDNVEVIYIQHDNKGDENIMSSTQPVSPENANEDKQGRQGTVQGACKNRRKLTPTQIEEFLCFVEAGNRLMLFENWTEDVQLKNDLWRILTEKLNKLGPEKTTNQWKKSFQSVLLAIEERLRNLDTIYSMQLSETLKSKMEQYSRKLESLDAKIIRLESMMMLNLDKISENISTKNYKDDVTRTQTYRKLENIYDGLGHRINYMDQKVKFAFEKIQSKLDSTLHRLERMEEDMVQRNADIESELSETLSILEESKGSTANAELVLLNVTNMLKETVSNRSIIQAINLTMNHIMQNFNESVTERLDLFENSTFKILDISEETNIVLKTMKEEVKEDFNAYANKVADMNVDIWKRNDIAEERLKTIEAVTNSTRAEIQNGVRALMLQTGKLSGKGIINNDKTSLESLKKGVNLSLEKIITNQELFLESCHRVQMDESQIESEISVMLGKLIDMLEKKMTTVMKDLKSIDKTVKNHDSRINRNLNQANTNIISLFEKSTRANDFTEKELQDIKFYINTLITSIQDVLPPRAQEINNTQGLLNDISLNISTLIQLINRSYANSDMKLDQLKIYVSKNQQTNDRFIEQIKNATEMLLKNGEFKQDTNLIDHVNRSLMEIETNIVGLQKTLDNLHVSDTIKEINYYLKKCSLPEHGNKTIHCGASETNIDAGTITNNTGNAHRKRKCTLIDLRAGVEFCADNAENQEEGEKQLNKTILDIFGTPPAPSTSSERIQAQLKGNNLNKNNKKCFPTWANLINIRYDDNGNCTVIPTKAKLQRRRNKIRLQSRVHDNGNITNELAEEDDDYEDLIELTTELTTEIISTDNPTMENLEEVTNKTIN